MSNMHSRSPAPVREVLYELSLTKEVPDAGLLDEFVRRYPEHADALTDFAVELVMDCLRGTEGVDTAVETTTIGAAVSRAMSTFQNALYKNRKASACAVVQETTQADTVDNP